MFTTSNREKPSFHLEASTIEYRPNDEVVLKNVVAYVGEVPVFYFPVFVQSLTDSRRPTSSRSATAASSAISWTTPTTGWPTTRCAAAPNSTSAKSAATPAALNIQYFPSTNSDILLKTYFAQDNLYSQTDPTVPKSAAHGNISDRNVYDGVPFDSRYRIAYQHYLQFGPDFSSTADLNLWSDPWITRDYFQNEYQQENQPPNFVSLNQYNPNFSISLLVSPQVNPFFETVERLPEFLVESKQQKIFGSPVEYTSQSSVVNFERKFADLQYFRSPQDYPFNSFPNNMPAVTAYNFYHPNQAPGVDTSQLSNYSAYRYDTYHEFAYPHQYFNFLSLTPADRRPVHLLLRQQSEHQRLRQQRRPGQRQDHRSQGAPGRRHRAVGRLQDFAHLDQCLRPKSRHQRAAPRNRALLRFGLCAGADRQPERHPRLRRPALLDAAPAPRLDRV